MKMLPFKKSKEATLGIELEFQLIDPKTGELISKAKELIRHISLGQFSSLIKPEITQSMIEINSSIHTSCESLLNELNQFHHFLLKVAKDINICICGGGTHPFQNWTECKIFPTQRFRHLSHVYSYLSKKSTVFGMHLHIGCLSGDDAIYLTHALTRYVPQFIAISASSPFYEGTDTGFHTTRHTDFYSYPSSGLMPLFYTWREFSRYFDKMRKLKLIESMKDVYWDIRPKPEFGTVEIRVCDTPLTLNKAALIAAYIQTLSEYLLQERKIKITNDLYYLYHFNRFQACRYGYEGKFIDPNTLKLTTISKDILQTAQHIKKYGKKLKSTDFIEALIKDVKQNKNDATILKDHYHKTKSFVKVVKKQCSLWKSNN